MPLDTTGDRYRYHHLLEQWLRSELALTEPELLRVVHRRAALWFRAQARYELGFAHAMNADDLDLAASIVEDGWHDTMLSGLVFTVRDWFQTLGDDVLSARAPLTAAMARLSLNTGRPHDEVERWLVRAESVVSAGDHDLRADVDRVWSLHLRQKGDLAEAERRARAIALVRGDSPRCEDLTTLGSVLHLLGQLPEAHDVLEMAAQSAIENDDALDLHLAQGHLAAVYYEQGHLRRAQEVAQETLDAARASGLENWPTLLLAHYVLGQLAIDSDQPEVALEHLETALHQSRQARYRPVEIMILIATARHHGIAHHSTEARRLLELARRGLADMADPGRLADLVPAAGRQLTWSTPAKASTDEGTQLIEDLTNRELSVLRLLASELSLRDVARELYISHNTVKGHAKAIYRKLGVHSRQEAVTRAHSLGLL